VAGAGSGVKSKAVPPNAMLEDVSWFGDMWNPALHPICLKHIFIK
jgi:hypothetical protein